MRGPGLAGLAGLSNLQVISMTANPIEAQHLKHLASFPKLWWVAIGMRDVSGEAIANLQQLKRMRFLHVRNPAPDADDLEKLRASLPYKVSPDFLMDRTDVATSKRRR
ncbi:MAG: hypothetical protein KY475_15795 [Planctomycetes bacterium]|nr:hypothetical protein [Planctomycetota bacterium]